MNELEKLANSSFVTINSYLNDQFKEDGKDTNPGQWTSFELETITYDLAYDELDPLPPLLQDKIEILQLLNTKPELFYTEFTCFCYVCEVASGIPADFSIFTLPNSLQMVAGIYEVKELLINWGYPSYDFSDGMKLAIAKLLTEDGFSIPIEPFNFVDENLLVKGQSDEDTFNKMKGIKTYLDYLVKR